MIPFPRLWEAMQEVNDPRRARGQRYPFTPLMIFTVLAVLAGATSYEGVITFIHERRHQLNELFGTRLKRAPAVNTLRHILHSLSRYELEAAFRRHARDLASPPVTEAGRPVIALDGKTLKHSFDQLNDQAAAATLSAFASDDALILAHTELDGGGYEIAAVQEMIAELDVSGVLFTADAMHCQKKTFEAAQASGNALLTQVKDNQGRLLAHLKHLAQTQPATDFDETVTRKRRGRQEHRTVETFDVDGQLDPAWDGLIVQAARVHRLTWQKQSATGRWTESNETAFYVCQVPLSAADFNQAVRAHWSIENRNHYVRDVTLGEDDSRIRVEPGPFTRIRSFALNIFRANGVRNVSQARYATMLNPDKLLAYAGS